jgi:hypothetical protein
VWYFYAQPIYPYPDPYTPPVYVIQQTADPTIVVQTAPAMPPPPGATAAAAPQQPQYWYYCEESRSYYPYVTSCPGDWKPVPATPAGVKP